MLHCVRKTLSNILKLSFGSLVFINLKNWLISVQFKDLKNNNLIVERLNENLNEEISARGIECSRKAHENDTSFTNYTVTLPAPISV